MYKYALFFCLCLPFVGFTQSTSSPCLSIHDGSYYLYPKNSGTQYLSIRNGESLKEVQINTKDTSYWKVTWTNPCTYSMKFEKGYAGKNAEEKELLASHKVVCKINLVTDAYYIFSSYIDKVSDNVVVSDTMWFKARDKVYNDVQFVPITNDAVLRKARFSDTSKYAVLYAYRSKKFQQSLVNYLVSMNDIPMFVSSNKSAFIFKILKEGPSTFSADILKNHVKTNLDVKFGQKYYMKCDVHFGLPAVPELRIVEQTPGKEEFMDAFL